MLIGEPPNLWLARDTNGDLKADAKELVTDTYGRARRRTSSTTPTACCGAIDNWIYTSEHDGYLRLKNGKFETAATLSRGQWGATQDDAGRIYRNTNEPRCSSTWCRRATSLRNPTLAADARHVRVAAGPTQVNTVWPVRRRRGVNRGYQHGHAARRTARCARTPPSARRPIYRGDRLPAELHGNVFVAESAGNLVGRLIVSDDGTTLRARDGLRARRSSSPPPTSASGR